VKVGDLVKHKEDEVFGIVMSGEPIVYDVSSYGRPPAHVLRYRIHWEDMSSFSDESEKDFVVVSEIDGESR